jgi:hypothetical protein
MTIFTIGEAKLVYTLSLKEKIRRKVFFLNLIKTYDSALKKGIELEDIHEYLNKVLTFHDLELMTIEEAAIFREHELCESLTEYFDPDDLYEAGYLGEEDYQAVKSGFDDY